MVAQSARYARQLFGKDMCTTLYAPVLIWYLTQLYRELQGAPGLAWSPAALALVTLRVVRKFATDFPADAAGDLLKDRVKQVAWATVEPVYKRLVKPHVNRAMAGLASLRRGK